MTRRFAANETDGTKMGRPAPVPQAEPECNVLVGDCRKILSEIAPGTVQACITSPPYWALRDYGVEGQIGVESSPGEYVAGMVQIFRGVRRALRDDGTLWLNLGDTYVSGAKGSGGRSAKQDSNPGSRFAPLRIHAVGLRPKNLAGIPWRVALALQADGWILRSDIIWAKPNPMPESIRDRPTRSHEYLFLFAKSPRYRYDWSAIKEPFSDSRNGNPGGGGNYARRAGHRPGPLCDGIWTRGAKNGGRNKRTVWTITPRPYRGAHFAVMPQGLIEPCVKAGSLPGDLIMDPFAGAGTVGLVAKRLGRRFVGIELNPKYVSLAIKRIATDGE